MHDGRLEDFVAEVRGQILWGSKVHLPSDQHRQFALNGRQAKKTQAKIRLKLDEDVDIAVAAEI
jgi:hypothetical protein